VPMAILKLASGHLVLAHCVHARKLSSLMDVLGRGLKFLCACALEG